MATYYYRPPHFGNNPTWTPPRLPLTPSTPSPLQWQTMQPPTYPAPSLFQRCHLHSHLRHHRLRPLRLLHTFPQPHPNHILSRLHLLCRKSRKAILYASARSQPCRIGNLTLISMIFHDTGKANGIDFPSTVRSSKFSQFKDIEGMDPLQIPLWKFLYQGLNNTWLRRIAHGRDVYILPFDNIGTTVFFAELAQQLRSRNLD